MKGKRHVRNNFDHRSGFAVSGSVAHLASQPEVGVLSQWRAWIGAFDSDHPVTVGSNLVGFHPKLLFTPISSSLCTLACTGAKEVIMGEAVRTIGRGPMESVSTINRGR